MKKEETDLNLVVATKEEARWEGVRKELEVKIEMQETNLMINKRLLKIARKETKGLNSTPGKKKS